MTVLFVISSIGNKRAEAQSSANVLLVTNGASAASETIGRYYAGRRGVSQDSVCTITTVTTESIGRDAYETEIEQPIWRCIASARAHDRILYIVLTKGVPIRISGTAGRTGTNSSVDSELTLLYRRRTGQDVPVSGFVPNPYFAGAAPISSIKPFTHESQDIYLVTRIDGYTVQDALGLIDKAMAPVRDGRFVLDERASLIDSGGDRWLRAAAERLRAQGLDERVVLDESTKVVTNEARVLGYYSWGSNDQAIRVRHFGLNFLPGALAAMFVSTDARTLKEPPPAWLPSDVATPATVFGGSHQSLVGDLIREGVTGAAGHVDEPYLDATIRPDILFPAYVSGRNLAEAFYAAMPYLSWQTIVFGDPLCVPFKTVTLTSREIDPGLDAGTETPSYFARLRVANLSRATNAEAAVAYARSIARVERRDEAAVAQALEATVAADGRFSMARLELAARYEQAGRIDDAISQYRVIVNSSDEIRSEVGLLRHVASRKTLAPRVVAMNNLAYDLAVYRDSAQEALPLAERASTIEKDNPQFLDTLAWVQHLLHQDKTALASIRLARIAGAGDPDILWHSAVIHAALNDMAGATTELDAAVKLRPDLANREDVKQLRQRLTGSK